MIFFFFLLLFTPLGGHPRYLTKGPHPSTQPPAQLLIQITKDGVTVAKSIEFSDKYENMGAQLVKTVANRTNDAAGDGTTTATVLTRAIYKEGCKAVAAGMNPTDLRRGIQAAVNDVVKTLEEVRATPVADLLR